MFFPPFIFTREHLTKYLHPCNSTSIETSMPDIREDIQKVCSYEIKSKFQATSIQEKQHTRHFRPVSQHLINKAVFIRWDAHYLFIESNKSTSGECTNFDAKLQGKLFWITAILNKILTMQIKKKNILGITSTISEFEFLGHAVSLNWKRFIKKLWKENKSDYHVWWDNKAELLFSLMLHTVLHCVCLCFLSGNVTKFQKVQFFVTWNNLWLCPKGLNTGKICLQKCPLLFDLSKTLWKQL